MSGCFFDLLVPAMRVRARATKPGAGTKLMAEEIIMSFTQRNICDAFDYACADLGASSSVSELNAPPADAGQIMVVLLNNLTPAFFVAENVVCHRLILKAREINRIAAANNPP
jgi:hypothetical protein